MALSKPLGIENLLNQFCGFISILSTFNIGVKTLGNTSITPFNFLNSTLKYFQKAVS